MDKIFRHYKYIEPGEDMQYRSNKGGLCGGELVGVIVVPAWLPLPPGHVSNAWSFDFPIKYEELEGANQQLVHGAAPSLVDKLIATAKKLERDGCRVICADCGYFGHFQKPVSDAVDIPVYLSGVIQVPFVRAGLKTDQKIGIICGDAPHLTFGLFESCGVGREDYERCVIEGAQDEPEFHKFDKNVGNFNSAIVRAEIVGIAKKMQNEHPEIGAFLLECTDMPPYSASIQAETNLPVYDTTTMIKFLFNTVAQRHYGGWV